MTIDNSSQHSLLPVISQSGGLDFDFDSQSDNILLIKRDSFGNVSIFSTCNTTIDLSFVFVKLKKSFSKWILQSNLLCRSQRDQ